MTIPVVTLEKKKIATIVDGLSMYLADTMILYVKTLNYHWNMVGSEFFMYHKLLEDQYNNLADALDEVAERIRMLGAEAPATLTEFLKLASLKEGKAKQTQDKMVKELFEDHDRMSAMGRSLIGFCDNSNDQGTSDMIVDRIKWHDKASWLLRSHFTRR